SNRDGRPLHLRSAWSPFPNSLIRLACLRFRLWSAAMASINSNLVERQIATTLARLASLSNLQGMYLVERQIATTLPRLASLSNLQGMYLVERQIATTLPRLASLSNLQGM